MDRFDNLSTPGRIVKLKDILRATKVDPLALSNALSAVRVEWGNLLAEKELLGASMTPASRRKRGELDLKIAKLRKRDFELRQLCFSFGLSVSTVSDSAD